MTHIKATVQRRRRAILLHEGCGGTLSRRHANSTFRVCRKCRAKVDVGKAWPPAGERPKSIFPAGGGDQAEPAQTLEQRDGPAFEDLVEKRVRDL